MHVGVHMGIVYALSRYIFLTTTGIDSWIAPRKSHGVQGLILGEVKDFDVNNKTAMHGYYVPCLN